MLLKPDYNLKNVYEINLEELKQQGIKCLMFDLDSTAMVSKPGRFTKNTLDWFDSFINDFEVAIISNNKNVIIVGGTGLYIKALLYDYKFTEEEVSETYDELTNEEIEIQVMRYGTLVMHCYYLVS